jgi:hypothetical protein
LLFVCTVLLLCGQWVLMRVGGEPYPALLMPAFEGDGGYRAGVVETTRMDVVLVQSDGSQRTFQPSDLFSDFDSSYQRSLALKFLSPTRTQPEARSPDGPRGSLRRLSRQLIPGLHRGQRQRDAPDNQTSLQGWLKSRVVQLLPNQEVTRVEFQWFNELVSVAGDRRRSTQAPLGVFVVSLEADGLR